MESYVRSIAKVSFITLLFCCKTKNNEREVFMGLKLGSSVSSFNKYLETLIENKKLVRKNGVVFNIKK